MTNQQANLLEKLYATEAYARIFEQTGQKIPSYLTRQIRELKEQCIREELIEIEN